MAPKRLTIPQALRSVMHRHIQSCLPEEACGLLAGSGGHVSHLFPITNAAHSATRFRMEPSEQVQTMFEMEQNGLELLAVFHSHPLGPPRPSQTDLDEARYPGVVSVICFPSHGVWRERGFLISDGAWEDVEIHIAR